MVSKLETFSETFVYKASPYQIAVLKEQSTCSQAIRLECHRIYFDHSIQWTADSGDEFVTSSGDIHPNCSCPFTNTCVEGKET